MRLWRWLKSLFRKRPAPVATKDSLFKPNEKRQDRLIRLYSTMRIETMGQQKESTVDWYITKASKGEAKYMAVAEEVGCPWQVVAVVHAMEASFDWTKNLMNGQDYRKKTTWVPKGHGGWNSWHDAAVAAFELKMKQGKLPTKWTLGNTLEFLLYFNGTGYERRGLVSAYLFSFSNHYVKQGGSKYVSDGKFDRNAISMQVGAAVILKELGFGE